MSPEELQQQKDIQLYAASAAAWVNTALEHDRSLLALSAGGIGLLITLLTTAGVSDVVLLVLYILAIFSFLAALVVVLAIFKRNRTHVVQVVQGNPALDPLLTVLDHVAVSAFGIGAILTAVIGISTAVLTYSTAKEKQMASENKAGGAPAGTFTKSLNGLGSLQTTASAPPPPAQTQAQSSGQQSGAASSSAAASGGTASTTGGTK